MTHGLSNELGKRQLGVHGGVCPANTFRLGHADLDDGRLQRALRRHDARLTICNAGKICYALTRVMKKARPTSVTGAPLERALVDVVVGFANQRTPNDPGAVEAYFKSHPWAGGSPFWLTIDPGKTGESDPNGALRRSRAADFAGVQGELRRLLAEGLTPEGRHVVRKALVDRLPPLLAPKQFTLPDGSAVPVGRIEVSYHRGRFSLGFRPFLTGVQATIDYGLALLFDTQRDFDRGLTRCAAPIRSGQKCGKFFWRSSRSKRYCSEQHAARARLAATKRRVQNWRRQHSA